MSESFIIGQKYLRTKQGVLVSTCAKMQAALKSLLAQHGVSGSDPQHNAIHQLYFANRNKVSVSLSNSRKNLEF